MTKTPSASVDMAVPPPPLESRNSHGPVIPRLAWPDAARPRPASAMVGPTTPNEPAVEKRAGDKEFAKKVANERQLPQRPPNRVDDFLMPMAAIPGLEGGPTLPDRRSSAAAPRPQTASSTIGRTQG